MSGKAAKVVFDRDNVQHADQVDRSTGRLEPGALGERRVERKEARMQSRRLIEDRSRHATLLRRVGHQ